MVAAAAMSSGGFHLAVKNTFVHVECASDDEWGDDWEDCDRRRGKSDMTFDMRLGDMKQKAKLLRAATDATDSETTSDHSGSRCGSPAPTWSPSGDDASPARERFETQDDLEATPIASPNLSFLDAAHEDVDFELVIEEQNERGLPRAQPFPTLEARGAQSPALAPTYGLGLQQPYAPARENSPGSSPQYGHASSPLTPAGGYAMVGPHGYVVQSPPQSPGTYPMVQPGSGLTPGFVVQQQRPDGSVQLYAVVPAPGGMSPHHLPDAAGSPVGSARAPARSPPSGPASGPSRAASPASGPSPPPPEAKDAPTNLTDDCTLMLRNIPNKYTQDALLEDLQEYVPWIDFLYLPTDFKNLCNLGYAFLNFADAAGAEKFVAQYHAQRLPRFPHSPKVLALQKARVQGLSANIERLRTSSVMGVLDSASKPLLFKDGERVDFPEPLGDLPPPGVRRKRNAPRYANRTSSGS